MDSACCCTRQCTDSNCGSASALKSHRSFARWSRPISQRFSRNIVERAVVRARANRCEAHGCVIARNNPRHRGVFALLAVKPTLRGHMPKPSSLMPRVLVAALTFASVLGSLAWAQQPPTVRIRGTIEAVDGPLLTIKSREGTDMKVRVTDNVAVFGVAKIAMSEIKPGSYIGVTAMPEPDGTQKAVAVHIFPENQRGAAEGFRPWDLRAGSTMTNATVAETVAGTD